MNLIENYVNNLNRQQTLVSKDSPTMPKTNLPSAKDVATIKDEFVKTKQNNGLIRKLYNFLKNKTNKGIGSNSVEKDIAKFEKGEISKDELDKTISKYKASQKNIVQTTGDVVATATTVGSYYVITNFIKKTLAQKELKAIPGLLDETLDILKKNPKFSRFLGVLKNIAKSNVKTSIVLLPLLAYIGGSTKLLFGQVERIGSKEFKKDKTLDKAAMKADKKAKRKMKRKENWKNFYTGAIGGMLAPVTSLAGGFVGVPAYLAAITGLRYVTTKNDGNKKSFKDFTQTLKDNAVVNTVTAAAIAIPAFKHAHYSSVLGSNLEKVVSKLKGKELHLPEFSSQKTAYSELEDSLLESPAIKNILKSRHNSTTDKTIEDLTNENIFAVKFLQIKSADSTSYYSLSNALRENCPPTRTLEQAQEHINKMWGSSEFKVSKLLGVGTVAETYLAKDKTGKDVCVKVLKEGITAEKIAKDKEKFIKVITGETPLDKISEDKKYLIRNIEDLADGISKEVDFVNEMNAAKELKKYCKVANVVEPIAAKPGIYVMEKAPGISVKTLKDYYECELGLIGKGITEADRERITKDMERIKSHSPEWENFELTPAHIKRLLNAYIDLHVEQFTKINKNGKVIHADIHPGNIFINLEALKSGKGKLFTLIDTGNTIQVSKEQTKAALRLTKFIQNGNTKDLSNIVLDGAILPEGLTKEQALQKIEGDLKKFFFDNETKIETMTVDKFYELSDNLLRKYKIISNNTQLNLNKAKKSANNSFKDLTNSFFSKKFGDKVNEDSLSETEAFTLAIKAGADYTKIKAKKLQLEKFQETKNLIQMSPKEALSFLRNKNMLKTNSEDYLTFEMKQQIKTNKKSLTDF